MQQKLCAGRQYGSSTFFVAYFGGLFALFTHKYLIYRIVDDVLKNLIKLEIMNYDFMGKITFSIAAQTNAFTHTCNNTNSCEVVYKQG